MAAERSVKMLAFGGDVLVFQSKSLISKTRDHGKGCEVSLCSLSFNRDSQIFSTRGRNVCSIHKDSSAEIDIVRCSSALDVERRQKVACVLLRLCKRRTSAFKYVLYSVCTSDVKLHVEFALPYEMRDHVCVLRGPTVVWSQDNSVFYASSQSGGVKEVQIPLTVSFIGELPLLQGQIVLQGSQNVSGDPSKLKHVLHFIEDGRTVDGACLVPDAYSSVIQSMMVFSAEEAGGCVKSSVLVATSMKQLVHLENGLPVDVCPLPYEQPLDIRMVHTLKNDCLIVITFSQGNVCAVWKHEARQGKVASCWSGVRLLLVDDFLGCGTDQMLFLFGDQSWCGETIDNFLLTDLCGVTYSVRQCGPSSAEVLNTSDAAQENHLLIVQALESRLQSGLSVLEELDRDVRVKDRLLQQTLTALNGLLSGRGHPIIPPEQEGLVSLWDEDDDDEDDEGEGVVDDGMQTECPEALLKVHRVWQRVVGQSLIIGVLLTAADYTCVMDVSVSVAVEAGSLNSRTEILPFPSSDASVALGPSAVKKIRRSECSADGGVSRLALVTVTDAAPLLTAGRIRRPIMLHYSTRQSSGECVRVSQHASRISLSLKDISTGRFAPRLLQDCKLNTDEAREDLLSLLALLDVCSVLVECQDHTLADVQLWLQESLGFLRLTLDPRFTADPTGLRLFRWEQTSPFQAVLSIYCRDDLHLLHFLHSLCDFLPVSHDIELLKGVRSGGGLALTLETEMHTVTQAAASLLQSRAPVMNAEGEESGEESQPLHRLREAWQRERGRCFDRLHPLLDITRYSRLTEGLIDTQMKTDEAVLMKAARL